MSRLLFVIILLLSTASIAQAEVRGQEVDYRAGDTRLKGYLAYDDAVKGKRPGILVVHEWWGHNEYARKRARMLAELGYTALAVDMYGEGKQADHPDDAAQFAAEVRKNLPRTQARFEAALKLLREHETTDAEHTGAVGYCLGGGVALEMARRGLNLDGVVSVHGSLNTMSPAKPGQLKPKILILTGADDPFIPAKEIEAFESEMKAAKADYRLIAYPGAVHSFSNPDATAIGEKYGLPLRYDETTDKASWEEMRGFFETLFQ